MSDYTHLRLERDWEGVARLWLDKADSSTNTLSSDVLAELGGVLDELEAAPPSGLVIVSAKPGGFIAGADITEFDGFADVASARRLVERGWALIERVAQLRFPTLALIHGHCMGGGLELALACRYRVVVDEDATRLALPEVMLGIVPAWGGMRRLPERVGPVVALDLMLTGRTVDARRAQRIGLADACVPRRVMDSAARKIVMSGKASRRAPWAQRVLNAWPLRRLVAARARKQLAARPGIQHYPAPAAIIDMWEQHDGNALAVPHDSPAALETVLGSDTARQLLRVFHLRERLRHFGRAAADGAVPAEQQHVHVIGAGVMGGDIAAWCAGSGFRVSLQDQDAGRIAAAIGRARKGYERRFRNNARKSREALDRLIPDLDGHGIARADVIIEAVAEDLAVKQALFADIEARAPAHALLASNTSSLNLADIAQGLRDPGRLVGIHFFNPVARMPLVEVVAGAHSDPARRDAALRFVRLIDKLPLPVQDHPGFLVNAVLGPYLFEALRCVEEGVEPEQIDAALEDFGMPMGPIELVDRVGLDIALAAGEVIGGGPTPPVGLTERVARGDLGSKSGQGYYRWQDGKADKKKPTASAAERPELAQRILRPLLAAARDCAEREVVADADLVDAGMIFGAGFAPYTGGPLQYAARLEGAGGTTLTEDA